MNINKSLTYRSLSAPHAHFLLFRTVPFNRWYAASGEGSSVGTCQCLIIAVGLHLSGSWLSGSTNYPDRLGPSGKHFLTV